MLHKTASRVESEGLTQQGRCWGRSTTGRGHEDWGRWRYLTVSRQNLAGLIGRMERQGQRAAPRMGATGAHAWWR